jgi:uncharacterized protein YecE (DUF72 family)
MERRIGTAGWSIPANDRVHFADAGTLLERYAGTFTCVEINSSFYRPHRPSTYQRWAASVPAGFRFSLKVPKTITHEHRLAGTHDLLARFLTESEALGAKRDVLLVQLPPSLDFEAQSAEQFWRAFRALYDGRIACEPRHKTWFTREAEAVLRAFAVSRVAADPVVAGGTDAPGTAGGFTYRRLHGAPRIYWSAYDAERLSMLGELLRETPLAAWCIFDNTAAGAATANALALQDALAS